MRTSCALGVLAFALAVTPSQAALRITDSATQGVTCSVGVCSAAAKMAVLNVTDLAGMLASGDVTVVSGATAQDIEIDTALSWTSAQRLTLNGYRSITFNAPVVVAGAGGLTITTNTDGSSKGDFRFFKKGHVEFWDLTSSLIINGDSYHLEDKLNHLARAIRRDVSDNYALAKSSSEKSHSYDRPPIPSFAGKLEGLGNTISNLTINDTDSQYVGLISEGGNFEMVIRDIGLKSVNINSRGEVTGGLIAEFNGGAILNSHVTGRISTINRGIAGGLVGVNGTGTIKNSFADVAVSGTGTAGGSPTLGGLVGEHQSSCTDLRCNGVIEQSFALGSVSGSDGATAGGLVGLNDGGLIMTSYARGAASGGNSALVGGLIGNDIDAPQNQSVPQIVGVYSTGAVSGGSGASVGGLIGQDATDSHIRSSYWDLDTSGISDPHQGAGNISDAPGITGLTTEQLTAALPAGFNPSVWKHKAKFNSGYPYLVDNQPSN